MVVNYSFFTKKVKKLQLTTQENKKKKTAVDQWSTAVFLPALPATHGPSTSFFTNTSKLYHN